MTEKRFSIVEDKYGDIWIKEEGASIYIGNLSEPNVKIITYWLNELNDEIKKLRTLNYVNKEAVRLNSIKTVKIGNNDVDCSNIDWELLYELYGAMIDYYYDGDDGMTKKVIETTNGWYMENEKEKVELEDIIGLVQTDEPTNSVQLKKEAQLSICEKRIIELRKENEQLKSENQHIKNLITEAYTNERTDLGRSVLKQLLETIQ